MLVARFYFKPGCADQWAWSAGQSVIEVVYESAWEVVEFCQEIEDLLLDCVVYDGHQITSLKVVSKEAEEKEAKTPKTRTRKNVKKKNS